MLTVSIAINGQVIFARSAVNQGEPVRTDGKVRYLLDDGSEVWHRPEDGAVALAHRCLDTIWEQGRIEPYGKL